MPRKSSEARVTFSTLPSDDGESTFEGCGIRSFRPAFLQRLADPKVYLIFYCILGVLQGAYFTYTIGIISTIEKRFSFDSRISGLILIADNLSPIITSLLIGYYGGQAHRPHLIGGGMMIVVLSCVMSAFPYFIFGPGLHMLDKNVPGTLASWTNGTKYETCGSGQDFSCEAGESSSAKVPAVTLFFLANFLNGFGSAAFYSAGVTYLDDNIKKKDSPMYFSVTMAIRLFGPSLGFLLSSVCLKYYEDPTMEPNLSRTDPRWVGAWWMGFLIIGTLLFIFTIPIFFFPKRLRRPKSDQEEKVEDTPMPKIKDMPRALLKLSKNKMFMFHTIGVVFHINGLMGYFLLMPRYMEAHFRKSASGASLISGSTSIITMLLGIMLGGLVIRRYKPRARFLTGYMVFVNSISMVVMLVVMFISCPPPALDAPIVNGQASLINDCNADCSCNTRIFQPVCGVDGKSLYFSPCHAGCRGSSLNDTTNSTLMTSCVCTSEPYSAVDLNLGFCPFQCTKFLTYILILSIAKLVSSTARVGNTIITLRCVEPKEKTLALGAIGCIFSLFAFIPYPLIFGAIADSTCLVWEESCGRRGNCWLYDVDQFRLVIHGSCFVFMVAGTFFDILVWAYSGNLTDLYDDVIGPTPPVMYDNLKTLPNAGQWRKEEEEDEDHVLFLRGPLQTGSVNDVRGHL